MEQLTPNVWTETRLRGCNPSFVVTSAGVVVIDTPQLPSKAVAMRREAETHGPIRFVINTEHHVDHIFGNHWFKGAGTVVHHQGVHDRFMAVFPELDPFAYALEAIPTDDPDGAALVPERDAYYADLNKYGIVFTGDTVFSDCATWLMTSDVDQWVAALDRIRALDVDRVVPGHGPVTTLDYLATQRAMLLEWKAAVAVAIAKGWSREETVARVGFVDRFPVDIGQEYMMEYIQTMNAGSLWDKLTALPERPGC